MITCRDFIEFLADYLARELPAQQHTVFDEHVADCPNCSAYLRSYTMTVKLGKAACTDLDGPAPAEVPEKLLEAIRAARSK